MVPASCKKCPPAPRPHIAQTLCSCPPHIHAINCHTVFAQKCALVHHWPYAVAHTSILSACQKVHLNFACQTCVTHWWMVPCQAHCPSFPKQTFMPTDCKTGKTVADTETHLPVFICLGEQLLRMCSTPVFSRQSQDSLQIPILFVQIQLHIRPW
jgi:hypothetical protein